MTRSYLYKLLRSPLTYAALAGVLVLCLYRVIAPIRNMTVVSQLRLFYNLTILRKVVYIFAALPFAGNFADEWTNSVTTSLITRCGLKKYVVSNAAVCFISSAAVVFAGIILFAWGYSFFIPLYIESDNDFDASYHIFLYAGLPFLKIVFDAFVFAVSCGFWSVVGMTISAVFPNKYVSICAPVTVNFVLERVTALYPAEINLKSVALSYLRWDNPAGMFLYSIGFYTLLSAVFTLVFALLVKRRVQNEIA